jgi:hypothetical protein
MDRDRPRFYFSIDQRDIHLKLKRNRCARSHEAVFDFFALQLQLRTDGVPFFRAPHVHEAAGEIDHTLPQRAQIRWL